MAIQKREAQEMRRMFKHWEDAFIAFGHTNVKDADKFAVMPLQLGRHELEGIYLCLKTADGEAVAIKIDRRFIKSLKSQFETALRSQKRARHGEPGGSASYSERNVVFG